MIADFFITAIFIALTLIYNFYSCLILPLRFPVQRFKHLHDSTRGVRSHGISLLVMILAGAVVNMIHIRRVAIYQKILRRYNIAYFVVAQPENQKVLPA